MKKNNNKKSKWIKYKIFELNYVNEKLSSVWKDKELGLVLAVFPTICLYLIRSE